LKEQNVAIEIIVESTGLSYEAIQRIWANHANKNITWDLQTQRNLWKPQ
jgi:hypothetical protein